MIFKNKTVFLLSIIAIIHLQAADVAPKPLDIKQPSLQTKSLDTKGEPQEFKSKLLEELEVTINKINEKENERKLALEKEMQQLEAERKKLDSTKTALEKERMAKGIITGDDVTREEAKLDKEKKLLQQKIQYAQVEEQYNASNLKAIQEQIQERIKFYKEVKATLPKEYIVTSEQFDYVNVGEILYAYVNSEVINSLIKKSDTDLQNEEILNMKILMLQSGLNIKVASELKQLLTSTSPSTYKLEKAPVTNLSTNTTTKKEFLKIETNQKISEHIHIKKIDKNSIVLVRK